MKDDGANSPPKRDASQLRPSSRADCAPARIARAVGTAAVRHLLRRLPRNSLCRPLHLSSRLRAAWVQSPKVKRAPSGRRLPTPSPRRRPAVTSPSPQQSSFAAQEGRPDCDTAKPTPKAILASVNHIAGDSSIPKCSTPSDGCRQIACCNATSGPKLRLARVESAGHRGAYLGYCTATMHSSQEA